MPGLDTSLDDPLAPAAVPVRPELRSPREPASPAGPAARPVVRRVARPRPAGAKGPSEPGEPHVKLSRAILVMLLLHVVAIGGVFAFSLIKERSGRPAAAAGARARGTPRGADHAPAAGLSGGSDPVTSRNPAASSPAADRGWAGGGAGELPAPAAAAAPNTNPELPPRINGAALPPVPPPLAGAAPAPGRHPALTRSTNPSQADAIRFVEGGGGAGGPRAAAPAARLPGRSPEAAPARHPRDPAPVYVVSRGETVSSIARKFRVNYNALLRLNGLDDPKQLRAGQKLRLPPTPAPAREQAREH